MPATELPPINGWRAVVFALAAVAAATLLGRAFGANEATAVLVYLLAVLVTAIRSGWLGGIASSLLATACFNFFFIPPVGTFHVADRANWAALLAFLTTSALASRIVARERRRALEAESRQREIEALYELSIDLARSPANPRQVDAAVARALRAIGVQGGGIRLAEADGGSSSGAWVGAPAEAEAHRLLRQPAPALTPAGAGDWRNVELPVAVGERVVGTLVAYGTKASGAALESLARLVGLAIERERLLAEQARLEALQESDALKTALLRAVSHDLSTPLTAMRILLESLRRTATTDPEARALVDALAAETARLERRVENLLAMARLEAGAASPHREPTPAADLLRSAREHLNALGAERRFEVAVEENCPDLDVDPSLMTEILVNLIENAHRAAPDGSAIELHARRHPSRPGWVRLEVLDRGGGVAPESRRLGGRADAVAPVAERPRSGLGLEIARSFAAAHGGTVELLARDGGGACARCDLPAAAGESEPKEVA